MGHDYYRMRVDADKVDELAELIEAQAFACRQYGGFGYDMIQLNPERLPTEDERKEALTRYPSPSRIRSTRSCMSKTMTSDADIPNSHRLVVSYMKILPMEWRIEAYRTILPAEVASYLDRWQTFVDETRAGKHLGYWLAFYRFDETYWALDMLDYLKHLVGIVDENTEKWAELLKVTDIPARIAGLSINVYEPPRWADWADKPDALSWREAQAQADAFESEFAPVYALEQDAQQIVYIRPLAGPGGWGDFIELMNDEWVDEFLEWVQQTTEDGMGLYLSI